MGQAPGQAQKAWGLIRADFYKNSNLLLKRCYRTGPKTGLEGVGVYGGARGTREADFDTPYM